MQVTCHNFDGLTLGCTTFEMELVWLVFVNPIFPWILCFCTINRGGTMNMHMILYMDY